MAVISQEMYEVVNGLKWSEDNKQDFYIRWLSRSDDIKFENKAHMATFCNKDIAHRRRSDGRVDSNRARLELLHAEFLREEIHERSAGSQDPSSIIERQDTILIKLESLSAALKDTLIQYYIEGRSPEEIAETGNENVEAVRKRITRARNILKGE